MSGSRRRLLIVACAAVVVASTTGLVGVHALTSGPARLGPKDYDDTSGVHLRVGERDTAFAGDFGVHGSDPVHVRSVRLTGVPRGIRVVGIYGLEGGPPGGAQSELDAATRARLRPVTDMVFRPGAPREEWGLVIVLQAVEPGTWVTTGIDVSWRAGWRHGTAHYNHRYELAVTA
jgi:hypothetical protein